MQQRAEMLGELVFWAALLEGQLRAPQPPLRPPDDLGDPWHGQQVQGLLPVPIRPPALTSGETVPVVPIS